MINILIAEDDYILRDLYEEWIPEALSSNGGAVVEIASSGTDARSKLENKSFDVTVLDIALPGESGIDLYNSLGNNMGTVILASSYADIFGYTLNGENKKCILNKPFNKEEFLDLFCEVIKEYSNAYTETERDGRKYTAID